MRALVFNPQCEVLLLRMGSQGIRDQQLARRWVQDDIAAFGSELRAPLPERLRAAATGARPDVAWGELATRCPARAARELA